MRRQWSPPTDAVRSTTLRGRYTRCSCANPPGFPKRTCCRKTGRGESRGSPFRTETVHHALPPSQAVARQTLEMLPRADRSRRHDSQARTLPAHEERRASMQCWPGPYGIPLGFRLLEVEHPTHTELIHNHPETCTPKRILQGHCHLSVFTKRREKLFSLREALALKTDVKVIPALKRRPRHRI